MEAVIIYTHHNLLSDHCHLHQNLTFVQKEIIRNIHENDALTSGSIWVTVLLPVFPRFFICQPVMDAIQNTRV